MFDQLFGKFLVSTNCIAEEQLAEILKKQNKIRVKLGLIAVSEKYMTNEQADEVNRLQSMMDKRFGDIAVEKGYLTKEQVNELVKLQENAYLSFIQALMDSECMTMQGIEVAMSVFQKVNNYTADEMEALKSDDIDQMLRVFTKNLPDAHFKELIGILVRTCSRVIDNKIYIDDIYETTSCVANCYAEQRLVGDFNITLAFCGEGDNLLPIANEFADEQYEAVDEDVLDAVCEFSNCINGMFATALSYKNIDVDMEPPMYDAHMAKEYKGNPIYVIPIHVKNVLIRVIIVVE